MNKKIILIMGIFVMVGLVYALATFTAAGGGLVGHWMLDSEGYNSNTERITDKTPYENHGTGNLSSIELVRNGNAETGDTSNWNFDGVDSNDYHSGAYSFYEQGAKTVTSGDFIPVNLNREYNLEGWFKSNGTGGESKLYFGYIPYDENKVRIANEHVHVILGTETTLYEACNSEDKIVKIVDGTNWYYTITHEFMAFDIDDSGNYNDLPNRELSNVNIINLTDQGDYWEVEFNTNVGKTYPLGTKVRMHASGGSYMYVAAGGVLVPTSWTQYVDSSGVKGESLYGTGYDMWWRGTRYARILMLANYQQSADYKLKVDDISLIYIGATLTTDQMGQSDRAMSFNGVDDVVEVPHDSSLSLIFPLSAGGWVKPDRTQADPLGTITNKALNWQLKIGKDGRVHVSYYDGTSWRYLITTSTIPDLTWSHVFITLEPDGANTLVKIYINGDLDKSGTVTGQPTLYTGKLTIGRHSPGTERFNGSISEVRIYNRALSTDEIDTLYHSYRPKASSGSLQKGLVLDMPLNSKYTKDETAGLEVMTDRTPYSNDGQNYGATVGDDYTSFDGVDDYVNCGNIDIPKNGPATIVGWFNFNQFAKARDISGSLHTQLYQHKANDYFYVGGGGADYFPVGHTFSLDTWYHIALTYNGTHETALLYVNGVKYNVIIQSPDTGHALLSPFRISNNNFPGTISDVRIYNRALSVQEIKLLYDKGR